MTIGGCQPSAEEVNVVTVPKPQRRNFSHHSARHARPLLPRAPVAFTRRRVLDEAAHSMVAGGTAEAAMQEPPATPLKTLVLDMDETLIHATPYDAAVHGPLAAYRSAGSAVAEVEARGAEADASTASGVGDALGGVVEHEDGSTSFIVFAASTWVPRFPMLVRTRPFLRDFLRTAAARFEVVLFTAADAHYADQVLDRLDPDGVLICHRLYRDHCSREEGTAGRVKDLSRLGRPLEHTFIIDDNPVSFRWQPTNAVAIPAWRGERDDDALHRLRGLLAAVEAAATVYDVLDRQLEWFG